MKYEIFKMPKTYYCDECRDKFTTNEGFCWRCNRVPPHYEEDTALDVIYNQKIESIKKIEKLLLDIFITHSSRVKIKGKTLKAQTKIFNSFWKDFMAELMDVMTGN